MNFCVSIHNEAGTNLFNDSKFDYDAGVISKKFFSFLLQNSSYVEATHVKVYYGYNENIFCAAIHRVSEPDAVYYLDNCNQFTDFLNLFGSKYVCPDLINYFLKKNLIMQAYWVLEKIQKNSSSSFSEKELLRRSRSIREYTNIFIETVVTDEQAFMIFYPVIQEKNLSITVRSLVKYYLDISPAFQYMQRRNYTKLIKWIEDNDMFRNLTVFLSSVFLIHDLVYPSSKAFTPLLKFSADFDITFFSEIHYVTTRRLPFVNSLLVRKNNISRVVDLLKHMLSSYSKYYYQFFLSDVILAEITEHQHDCHIELLSAILQCTPLHTPTFMQVVNSRSARILKTLIDGRQLETIKLVIENRIIMENCNDVFFELFFIDFNLATEIFDKMDAELNELFIDNISKCTDNAVTEDIVKYFMNRSLSKDFLEQNIERLFYNCQIAENYGIISVLQKWSLSFDRCLTPRNILIMVKQDKYHDILNESHYEDVVRCSLKLNKTTTFTELSKKVSNDDAVIALSMEADNTLLLETANIPLKVENMIAAIHKHLENIIQYGIKDHGSNTDLIPIYLNDYSCLIMEHYTQISPHEDLLVMTAIKNKDGKLMKWLLDNFVSPLKLIKNNYESLSQAVKDQDYETIDFLLDHGVSNMDLRNNDNQYFRDAFQRGDVRMVKYLIGKGIKFHELEMKKEDMFLICFAYTDMTILDIMYTHGYRVEDTTLTKYILENMKTNLAVAKYLVNHYLVSLHFVRLIESQMERENLGTLYEDTCAICLEIVKDDFITCLHCQNKTHIKCHEEWIKQKNTCVYCRGEIN